MHKQSENFNKVFFKKRVKKSTELENAIPELRNSIARFHSRLDQVEESISKHKDRAVEFIQSEEQKEGKRMKIAHRIWRQPQQTQKEVLEGEERERERGRKPIEKNNS